MKKYDSVIEETIGAIAKGAWNVAGNTINTVKNIASIAKDVATSQDIKTFTDLFSKIKTKLKLVDHSSALKNSGMKIDFNIKNSLNSSATAAYSKIPWSYKYTPNSVIIDSDSKISGVVGRVINYNNDEYFKNFQKYLKDNNLYNYQNIINETKSNNRFWVIISPKGNNTIDNIEKSQPQEPTTTPEEEPTEPTTPATPQSAQSTIFASYDQKIQKYYSIISENIISKIIKSSKQQQPQNNIQYNSYFIYKSNNVSNQGNVGKIFIASEGTPISKEFGEIINLKDMGAPGLVLCGNKTLYPKWYFLNDIEEYQRSEESKEDKSPSQSSLATSGQNTKQPQTKPNNQTQNP